MRVLYPIIRLSRVLMDGGSSLNLIYAETLKKMQLDESRILYSDYRGRKASDLTTQPDNKNSQ